MQARLLNLLKVELWPGEVIMPAIPTTQEVEVGGSQVEDQVEQS
jgi:hypothetical protein